MYSATVILTVSRGSLQRSHPAQKGLCALCGLNSTRVGQFVKSASGIHSQCSRPVSVDSPTWPWSLAVDDGPSVAAGQAPGLGRWTDHDRDSWRPPHRSPASGSMKIDEASNAGEVDRAGRHHVRHGAPELPTAEIGPTGRTSSARAATEQTRETCLPGGDRRGRGPGGSVFKHGQSRGPSSLRWCRPLEALGCASTWRTTMSRSVAEVGIGFDVPRRSFTRCIGTPPWCARYGVATVFQSDWAADESGRARAGCIGAPWVKLAGGLMAGVFALAVRVSSCTRRRPRRG